MAFSLLIVEGEPSASETFRADGASAAPPFSRSRSSGGARRQSRRARAGGTPAPVGGGAHKPSAAYRAEELRQTSRPSVKQIERKEIFVAMEDEFR